ncbi:uncharacterized protein SPAPADRAFT_58007 [Spathaspora passalidarum NRRL Y-27907]|uniref:Maltose/galactoside acetyltransferase domain-containing protein n=1 Tax=Spathaspora passalidarum (strain NRRL Y-27907 / 11-Y1) TaxID=619300 RepID=G3AF92_SPAPN|nr:uncharacterized protein SPAPADRAFT_58007 [Spathaspora passalidarum NRRL Y-27907]EGW34881.1 hypothetical protein SPAPADRAFT_58007 [Spathaspora passalidarum NRRL Y-27907]
MPKFESKEDFCNQTNMKDEINKELVEFAYKKLNIPLEHGDQNYERMISGLVYNFFNQELADARTFARDYILDYEKIRRRDYNSFLEYIFAKREHLAKFIGHVPEEILIEYPVHFDYGFNTYFGKRFYSNYNLTILDASVVKIGDNVMCGPNVTITTATHALDPTLRANGLENALPVAIGNNVWLGAGSQVLPGVTIGDGCVIAAGAIVNKDIPENSVVVGVPGRVVKTLEPFDPNFDVQTLLQEYGMGFIP